MRAPVSSAGIASARATGAVFELPAGVDWLGAGFGKAPVTPGAVEVA